MATLKSHHKNGETDRKITPKRHSLIYISFTYESQSMERLYHNCQFIGMMGLLIGPPVKCD